MPKSVPFPKDPLPDRKIRAQFKLAVSAVREVVCAAFASGRPADRSLNAWFRANRQCGSRDRVFIGETLFSVWRYWGILRRALEPARLEKIEKGEAGPGARELELLTIGAIYLAGLDFPLNRLAEFHLPRAPETSPLDRGRRFLRVLDPEAVLEPEQLLPEWVTAQLAGRIDLAGYLERLPVRPPMWLRSQNGDAGELCRKLQLAGLDAAVHARLPDAIKVENARINLYTLPEFRAGRFEVQDLASQAIGRVAAPGRGERWLDLCAGAGGKTLQLAELMQRTGEVLAMDIRSYKLDDLRQRGRRSGFPNIRIQEFDGKKLKRQFLNRFDGVLADAPCSCSGVWRRNPDGCWTLKPEEISEMAELQFSILNTAKTGVRVQGVLIYATCSVFPEENTEVVKRFLNANPEFVLEAFEHPLTGEPVAAGFLQIMPEDGDCDAMFAARFRRRY